MSRDRRATTRFATASRSVRAPRRAALRHRHRSQPSHGRKASVCPSPAGPRPLRRRSRPLKLISVVSAPPRCAVRHMPRPFVALRSPSSLRASHGPNPRSGPPTALRLDGRRPRATPTSRWPPPAETTSLLLALDACRQNNRCEASSAAIAASDRFDGSELERQTSRESANFSQRLLTASPSNADHRIKSANAVARKGRGHNKMRRSSRPTSQSETPSCSTNPRRR